MSETHLIPFSAGSELALAASIEDVAVGLPDDASLGSVARTLGVRREHRGLRAATLVGTRRELGSRFAEFSEGDRERWWVSARTPLPSPTAVFVFSGQGSQWIGMARGLMRRWRIVSEVLEELDERVAGQAGFSLLDVLIGEERAERFTDPRVAQPVLFAVQVAIAKMWESLGIEASAVVGHSMGEVAAAHFSGALTLEDAVQVIVARGELTAKIADAGGMAVVALSEDELLRRPDCKLLTVSAANGPRETVVSGSREDVEKLVTECESRGVFARTLTVRFAAHTAQVVPLAGELVSFLGGIAPREGRVPFVSAVEGREMPGSALDARYWGRNLREPVRFHAALKEALVREPTALVEISPHPVLAGAGADCIREAGRTSIYVGSLRREQSEWTSIQGALAELFVLGFPVDFDRLTPLGAPRVALPKRTWAGERFPLPGGQGQGRGWEADPARARLLAGLLEDGPERWSFELRCDLAEWTQHRVASQPILPAAAHLLAALAAAEATHGAGALELASVEIKLPLQVPMAAQEDARVVIEPNSDGSPAGFTVSSGSRDDSSARRVHVDGRIERGGPRFPGCDLNVIRRRMEGEAGVEDHYAALGAMGLEYGEGFRRVESIAWGDREALGRLRSNGGGLDAPLLDSALQLIATTLPAGFGREPEAGPYVPVGVERFLVRPGRAIGPGDEVYAHAILRSDVEINPEGALADVAIVDRRGELVCQAAGVRLRRRRARSRDGTSASRLYGLGWRRADAVTDPGGVAAAGAWWVVSRDEDLGRSISSALSARGGRVREFRSIRDAVPAAPAETRGIVVVGSTADDASPGARLTETITALRDLVGRGSRSQPVHLVTSGGQATPKQQWVSAAGAALWGMARSLARELSTSEWKRIDADPVAPADCGDLVVREILAGSEEEVALRDGERLVPRLESLHDNGGGDGAALAAASHRVVSPLPGQLDRLAFESFEPPALGDDEVEIEVAASGLNFSDVLKALDLYPEPTRELGLECAGTVIRVGSEVRSIEPGDEVVAMAPQSLASRVVTSAKLVCPRPPALDVEAAAAVPAALITARYALLRLADLRAGNKVLIHAAAGGVGLAAIELCRRRGAEVYATSSSSEKRDRLRRLEGVAEVLDSGSARLDEDVRAATGGVGVDIALNSLTGRAARQSVAALAPYGRFIELGKSEIYEGGSLGLAPFRENLSFFAVDLAKLAVDRQELLGELLAEGIGEIERGEFDPPPVEGFDFEEAVDAFTHMARRRHFGKIVLRQPPRKKGGSVGGSPESRGSRFTGDGSYLVTGGTGGIGLALAGAMVAQGARSLILVSRSVPEEGARRRIAEMEEAGAVVKHFQANVADRRQLEVVLEKLEHEGPPLRGVIHAAGVLKDSTFGDLTDADVEAVVAPKVQGSLHLDELTRGHELDCFVVISTLAALVGSPGQVHYAAANAFLDGLVARRRASGLPGLAIAYGPWAEVGMVGDATRERLRSRGLVPIEPVAGVDAFERMLASGVGYGVAGTVEWDKLAASLSSEPLALLAEVGHSPRDFTGEVEEAGHLAELDDAAPPERREMVVEHLARWLRRIADLDDGFDHARPLESFGMDSLMGVELMNNVYGTFRVDIPISTLLGGTTLLDLADVVLEARWPGEGGAVAVPAPATTGAGNAADSRLWAQGPFPLTELQSAYLAGRSGFGELSCPALQHISVEVDDLDPDRLERSVHALIDRHEMLRAVVLDGGRQEIQDRPHMPALVREDLRGLDETARGERLRAARADALAPGPLAGRWPLFDLRAFRLTERRWELQLTFELALVDAASVQVFCAELSRLYDDSTDALPDAVTSAFEMLADLAPDPGSEAFRAARDYWLGRLDAMPPPPSLPRLTGAVEMSFRVLTASLGEGEWTSLKSFSGHLGVTPSALLCAVYAEAIAMWSKEPAFTLNVTTQRRAPSTVGGNQVIGPFASVMPLAFDVGDSVSIGERARTLQRDLWEGLDHHQFSGIRIVRELARRRGDLTKALLPIVFTSALATSRQGEGEGSHAGFFDGAHLTVTQTPHVLLDHQVREQDGELLVTWNFVPDAFPSGVIEEMFDFFVNRIAQLAQPDAESREPVPKAYFKDRRHTNTTVVKRAAGMLHDGFLANAASAPDRLAVVGADRELTYGDLERASGCLASSLVGLGVSSGDLVAIAMRRGWQQVVAALAVSRAGAAYVPIDPSFPGERIEHLLDRCEPRVVLCQPEVGCEVLQATGLETLAVDEGLLAEDEMEAPVTSATPSSLAYVIFTSGSTGSPKGVMIEHRAAVNTILDVNERFGVTEEDRVLALSSLSFDLSVWDVFGTLAAGGSIVIPDPEREREPRHWLECVRERGVTVWNSVPALMGLATESAERDGEGLAALRLAMLSGDWIPVVLPKRLRQLKEDLRVVSLGGATEASIWSIFFEVDRVDDEWSSVPYGRPLGNQAFRVLDWDMRDRPDWAVGELYIGGDGLARGYWRDEEKTQAAFVLDPESGERLYRTGDIGRYMSDGNIEFLGREDSQVKVHGYRVELGEVEAAMEAHTGIARAVASAIGERDGDRRLVAFFEPDAAISSPSLDEIRQFLQEKLPRYMVPTVIREIERLPLTANGKVDRLALPSWRDVVPVEPAHRGAGGELLDRLAGLVADARGVAEVDPDLNLQDLGLSSVEILRLAEQIEDLIGVHLDVEELFTLSSLRDIAAYCERAKSEAVVAG